jgi:hypothetical protein
MKDENAAALAVIAARRSLSSFILHPSYFL